VALNNILYCAFHLHINLSSFAKIGIISLLRALASKLLNNLLRNSGLKVSRGAEVVAQAPGSEGRFWL